MSEQDQPIIAEFWYRWYPELRHFQSREELRLVKKEFRKQVLRRGQRWLLMMVLVITAGGMSLVAVHWLLSLGLVVWLATIINGALWALFGGFISFYVWHRPYIRFVRQYLQDHGVAVCLKCGYDLRGQTESRCPECGRSFDAQLLRHEKDYEESGSAAPGRTDCA